jgi:hypothetical protein
VRRDREPLFLTLFSENAGRKSGTAVEVAGFDETFSRRTEVAMATISLTKTVTVNAAFLQEIKEVHQELWKHPLHLLQTVIHSPIGANSGR